jgi:hypothetical protein
MDFHAEIIIAPPIREKPLPGIRQGLVIMRLRFGNRRNFPQRMRRAACLRPS